MRRVEVQLLGIVGDVEHRAEDQPQRVDGLHPRGQLIGVQDLSVDRRLDRVDARQPSAAQLLLGQALVIVLKLRILRVRRRVQPANTRVRGAEGEELPKFVEQLPDQRALALVEPQHVAALAREHAAARAAEHQSCRMVAHSPCSCRRKTSSSAFSRVPLETTARPL